MSKYTQALRNLINVTEGTAVFGSIETRNTSLTSAKELLEALEALDMKAKHDSVFKKPAVVKSIRTRGTHVKLNGRITHDMRQNGFNKGMPFLVLEVVKITKGMNQGAERIKVLHVRSGRTAIIVPEQLNVDEARIILPEHRVLEEIERSNKTRGELFMNRRQKHMTDNVKAAHKAATTPSPSVKTLFEMHGRGY